MDTVNNQIVELKIKGELLGTITEETSFKEASLLVNHIDKYSLIYVNGENEIITFHHVLNGFQQPLPIQVFRPFKKGNNTDFIIELDEN